MSRHNKYQPENYDIVVLYHGGCPDGLAAAWAFTLMGRKIYYQHVFERDFFADHTIPDLTDKHVYIVDFCYNIETIRHIRDITRSLTILDHHATANFTMDGVNTVFDITKCAAEIVLEYLFAEALIEPWWLIHIRDKDLWEWKHPDSRAFNAALMENDLSLWAFDRINNLQGKARYLFIKHGRALLRQQEREINKLCNFATKGTFRGYNIYAVNASLHISEVGAQLAARRDCDFAIVYRYMMDKNKWIISLRGDGRVDLGAIAKEYGGGGHKCACAFSYCGNIRDIIC